jgi:hypothetical protein
MQKMEDSTKIVIHTNKAKFFPKKIDTTKIISHTFKLIIFPKKEVVQI